MNVMIRIPTVYVKPNCTFADVRSRMISCSSLFASDLSRRVRGLSSRCGTRLRYGLLPGITFSFCSVRIFYLVAWTA